MPIEPIQSVTGGNHRKPPAAAATTNTQVASVPPSSGDKYVASSSGHRQDPPPVTPPPPPPPGPPHFPPPPPPLPPPPPVYRDPYPPYRDPWHDPWDPDYPFRRRPPHYPIYPPPPTPGEPIDIDLDGSIGVNGVVYYNGHEKKAELMPQVKGDLKIAEFGQEGAIGIGLAFGGNGSTNVATEALVGTINKHVSVELGVSQVWDSGFTNALHAGVNLSPVKHLNVSVGADVSGKGINPYLGVGARWTF